VIYLVGRLLEPWLIRRTFRKAIIETESAILPPADRAVSTEG
jgi:hypothetical protein